MKKKIQQLLVLIAGFVCSLILGVAFIAPANVAVPVSAATVIDSRLTGDTGLFIEEGAAVRVKSTSTETNGLRYTIGMSKSLYDTYMAEGSGIEDIVFGILIAPATDAYVLNQATVFGLGGEQLYDWAEKDQNGNWVYTGNKTRIINFETKKLFKVAGKPSDAYYYQGSVVNIKDSNLTSEFRGVGYVLYTIGGTRYCEMLTNDTHVRSIAYVAQKAIDDGNQNSTWLKQNYIDKATKRTWTYTTENYIEQANGSFVKDSTLETATGELGTTVYATNAPSFTGVHYDPNYDLGVSSGVILANDKLVLKRYYRIGYDMPADTTSTVKQTSSTTYNAGTDAQLRLIDNVGENYAAVTFSSSTATSGFTALVLNVMGSVENVWVGDLSLSISGNGIFLTMGNINTDSNRIASFNSSVLPNNSDYYTIVYKLTYQGNEYYSNGVKFELWMANHASGADLSTVTFTKATVGTILQSSLAHKHYLTKDLVLKYSALTETQYATTNCDWMLPGGWNAATNWTMRKAQILSFEPNAQASADATVNIPETAGLWCLNNDVDAIQLVNNYQTEYVSFTVTPANIPTKDSGLYYGICLNMLGETYNTYWNGGLILKLSNDGLLLWNGAINSDAGGTPIALFVSADHNYNWAGGFSICYKFDFSNENQVVMELYLKMGDGAYEVLEPIQLAGEGISYKDGKYTMRMSMFNFSPIPDSTVFVHSAYNTGCDYWTISNVGLSDNGPIQNGYSNPVTEDAAVISLNSVEEIDHTVDTIKTLATNVNENYMAITVKASDLANASYYGFGINILGTSTTGWDGGLVLSFTKDGVCLKYGGMKDTAIVLAQLGTGNITRLDTSITIAYKLSFGEGALSEQVSMQFWAASAGSAFAPLGCIVNDSLCDYDSSTQEYRLPYSMFTEEEYKSDCTVIFLAAHNNQTVPCDWELQDIEILSGSPDTQLTYWENPAYAGISVDTNGTMYLGSEKLYTAGVNCYSLYNQCWSANGVNITLAQKSLDALKNKGMKVVRFNCGGYLGSSTDTSAKTIAMYENNKENFVALLKDIVAYAEDLEIGLIPSFFWLYSAVPSYCGEAVSAWGDANSKTRAYMVEYTTTIVNELKGFHSIFGWEFGNEFNLHCDIPDSSEDFKLAYVNSAISAYNTTVKGLDVVSNRFIGSGHSAPRPAQYNLSINNGWTTDTDAQYSTVTDSLNPCNAISEHVYQDTTDTLSTYFTRSVSTAANLKKAYYVGEWGHGDSTATDYSNETYYQTLADAIIGAKVQLCLLWNYDITGATEKSFRDSTTRDKMLWNILANMNSTLETYV